MSKAAKEILLEDLSCASACYLAVEQLLTNQWLVWEPETVWIELARLGVDVPLSNREQIMAARVLWTTAAFFVDMHAFEKTCIVFNNEELTHVGVEDAPVMFISWAVTEAEKIYREGNETFVFDREPILYTAIQLYREGFLVAPEPLVWAQEELDKRNARDKEPLRKAIREAWAVAPKGKDLLEAAFPETPAGVQLAKLAAVEVYHARRAQERLVQLAKLSGPRQ